MARRKWRKRSGGRRALTAVKRMIGTMGWWRPGALTLSALSAGTPEATALIMAGSDLKAQPSAVLDMGERYKSMIIRILMRATVQVAVSLAQWGVEYWWGWRLAELQAGGGLPSGTQPSVFVSGPDSKREDWLYRGNSAVLAPPTTLALFPGDGGSSQLLADIKPGRPLPYGHGLLYCHGIRAINGGAIDANAVVSTSLNAEVLVRVP